MVGIPDGLGAYESRPGTFTLLSNHEIATPIGHPARPRRSGRVRLEVGDRAARLRVAADATDRRGRDLEHGHELVQPAREGRRTQPFLLRRPPGPSAIYDRRSGLGYNGPLFLDGEEAGAEGRAFAHAEGGISWELPSLGKYSFENAVANPSTGRTTVVVGTDDTSPLGQVYVYVGEKKATGNPAERAGLTGGTLYGIKVPGTPSRAHQRRLPSALRSPPPIWATWRTRRVPSSRLTASRRE